MERHATTLGRRIEAERKFAKWNANFDSSVIVGRVWYMTLIEWIQRLVINGYDCVNFNQLTGNVWWIMKNRTYY